MALVYWGSACPFCRMHVLCTLRTWCQGSKQSAMHKELQAIFPNTNQRADMPVDVLAAPHLAWLETQIPECKSRAVCMKVKCTVA